MKTPFYAILVAGMLYSCAPSGESNGPNKGLIGTWSWNKYEFQDKDTSYVWNDVKGQAIFTDKYFSLIYVNQNGDRAGTRRVAFDSLTHTELKNSIGKVVANSGSYTIEGDSVVNIRSIALWPNAMATGNQRSTYPMPTRITKDTLYWEVKGTKNTWVRLK